MSDTPAAAATSRATSDPNAVLTRLASQLRSEVEGMKRGLDIRMVTTFLDERQACRVGASDWPAQWILDERIYLNTGDARPAAHALVARHASEGWAVATLPAADGADEYTLRHDGFVIDIAAGREDGSLNIQTQAPCVESDGSVDDAPSPPAS
ncbi:MAG TPA: hypothetical protein VI248_17970 [Kineosporiaceae bacterium]